MLTDNNTIVEKRYEKFLAYSEIIHREIHKKPPSYLEKFGKNIDKFPEKKMILVVASASPVTTTEFYYKEGDISISEISILQSNEQHRIEIGEIDGYNAGVNKVLCYPNKTVLRFDYNISLSNAQKRIEEEQDEIKKKKYQKKLLEYLKLPSKFSDLDAKQLVPVKRKVILIILDKAVLLSPSLLMIFSHLQKFAEIQKSAYERTSVIVQRNFFLTIKEKYEWLYFEILLEMRSRRNITKQDGILYFPVVLVAEVLKIAMNYEICLVMESQKRKANQDEGSNKKRKN